MWCNLRITVLIIFNIINNLYNTLHFILIKRYTITWYTLKYDCLRKTIDIVMKD